MVILSDEQFESLLEELDLEMFDYYVAKLADYITRTGAKVKNHYATIRKWWAEDSRCDAGFQEKPKGFR